MGQGALHSCLASACTCDSMVHPFVHEDASEKHGMAGMSPFSSKTVGCADNFHGVASTISVETDAARAQHACRTDVVNQDWIRRPLMNPETPFPEYCN